MNCEFCQDLMQQQLDGVAVVVAPEVERHLAECSRCAALWATSHRLYAGLRLLTPPCPPLEFSERLVAGVLAERRARRRRGRVYGAVVGLAAGLLLAAAAVGLYAAGLLTPRQPVVVNNTPAPKLVPDELKPTPAPSVRVTVGDAGNALASLTTRTADETVGQTRLLVPVVTGPSLDELDTPPGIEPTKSYLEAGQGVSVALQPVTNSAERALKLFRRDLPHVERTAKAQ